jgi:TolB-like protein/Flp pilus assembly protein TadD
MSSRLSRFWQDLKRRKVTRTVTVYAASTFVILELLSIIIEPLKLPEWTLQFAIIFLCIGFIIAIILSWIYDIHPEEGIVKTEPASKVEPEDIPKASNSWKIASYISFVVIIGLVVLNVIPRNKNSEIDDILDKSIAILPFINDSPDQENDYFINGTMEAILNNLSKIKGLRVVSRSSVEQYRDTIPFIPEVARKLDVSFVIEGSMQKVGNRIRLFVQLIDHNDTHLWSEQYDRVIDDVENQLDLQSEIAQLVARQINVTITPAEKERIEGEPTTSLSAFDFYQRGNEEYWKYNLNYFDRNRGMLEKVEFLFREALKYDAEYARAYAGLARVYFNKNYYEEYFTENFLDSVLILADLALSFDDKLSEAYVLKGQYYNLNSDFDKALIMLDKAIELNPNEWMSYYAKASLFMATLDYGKAIENYHQVILRNRGPLLPRILSNLAWSYHHIGFIENFRYLVEEALELTKDSTEYYTALSGSENHQGNFQQAINYSLKLYELDSTNWYYNQSLGYNYMFARQHVESLKYYRVYLDHPIASEELYIRGSHRVGYALWKNGLIEEANFYLDRQLEYLLNEINLERPPSLSGYTYYDLAGVYAFRGDKEEALKNLKTFNQKVTPGYMITSYLRTDPLFDNIRDEPEFQQIVLDVEAKYQAEHTRVRQWLEENDLLVVSSN